MSALLEFECRPSVSGYDVIAIDPAQGGLLGLGLNIDYLVHDWGTLVLASWRFVNKTAEKIELLRPRSQRTRHFDLFQSNQSAYLEFAQTPLTADAVKALADRYGPLRTKQEKVS